MIDLTIQLMTSPNEEEKVWKVSFVGVTIGKIEEENFGNKKVFTFASSSTCPKAYYVSLEYAAKALFNLNVHQIGIQYNVLL